MSPAAMAAKSMLTDALARLKNIDVSLTRLVELGQGPREMLFAAGSTPFGGTVGTTPASNTYQVSGQATGVVLGANPHRRGLSIQNLSAGGGPNLTIGLGITSPAAGVGLTLPPGTSWDGRISGAVWPGSVSLVASAAGCTYAGVEILGRNEVRRRLGNEPI